MDASTRFQAPHLSLAKNYWKSHLKPDDFVIDMTCGNGHDTLFLAQLVPQGLVLSVDIQETALINAKELTKGIENIQFIHQSHSEPLPHTAAPQLMVYNLGYLPGGDKSITTQSESTLQSLDMATQILDHQGAISIMCYPGHPEGSREEAQVIAWAEKLDPTKWRVCLHRWLNRKLAPSLVYIRLLGR